MNADASVQTQSYDLDKRLITITRARDKVTTHSYKVRTGELLSVSDIYNAIGRLTTRKISRRGSVRNDTFGYNSKSELTSTALGSDN